MSREHRRLNRKQWARARRAALERDGWRCQDCGKAGFLEVDHIRPLADGGAAFDVANLQTLCRDCHFRKTGLENERPDVERDRWRELMKTYMT